MPPLPSPAYALPPLHSYPHNCSGGRPYFERSLHACAIPHTHAASRYNVRAQGASCACTDTVAGQAEGLSCEHEFVTPHKPTFYNMTSTTATTFQTPASLAMR